MKIFKDTISFIVACSLFLAFVLVLPLKTSADEKYTVNCIGKISKLMVWSSGRVEVYLSGTGSYPAIIPDGSISTSNMLDLLLTAHLHGKAVQLRIGSNEKLKCRSFGKDSTILFVETVDW